EIWAIQRVELTTSYSLASGCLDTLAGARYSTRRGVCAFGALDPSALRRACTVVRLRGDIVDRSHLEAGCLQRTDRGLTTRTRSLHEDVDLLDTVLLRLAGGGLRRHLGGVRGRLARTLEADDARRRPAQDRTGR